MIFIDINMLCEWEYLISFVDYQVSSIIFSIIQYMHVYTACINIYIVIFKSVIFK